MYDYRDIFDDAEILKIKNLVAKICNNNNVKIDASDIAVFECIFDDNNIMRWAMFWDTESDTDMTIRYNGVTKSYDLKKFNPWGFEIKNNKVVVKISRILSLFVETHIKIRDRQEMSSPYFYDDICNEEWDYIDSILDKSGVKLTDSQQSFLYWKSWEIAREVY